MTFWLPPIEEAAPRLRSNSARSGDADFKAPSQTKSDNIGKRVAKEKKKAARGSGKFDEAKHRRGGKGSREGGRFVSSSSGSSSQVKTVQDKLGIAQTGTYDAGTAATVVAFQKRHGLAVDGIIGRQTALALTGQYERARKVGPGALGPETSKLTGADSSPGRSKRRKGRGKGSARKGRSRGGSASGERVRGGAVIDGLQEEVSRPADPFGPALSEGVVDALGNVHDKLGKFSEKLGAKGGKAKGNEHAHIPEYDASALTFGKSAGGSNGARLAAHKDGSEWLVKSYGGGENRVATELLSNAVYRDAGARVPRAGRIKLHNGKQALAYPLLEGKPKPYVFQRRGAKPSADVGEHFMTDALLANWDVAGLEDDNILWDAEGKPFRVDQGGTLEYRAMGNRKPFGPVPIEVTTMLMGKGQGRRSALVSGPDLQRQARELHDRLSPGRIDQLVDAAGFKDAKMRERVRKSLKARVDWMGKFAEGKVGFPELPKKVEEEAAWLAPIQEMASEPFNWSEALHPRDVHGKFIKKLGGLKAGSNQSIQLDSKTYVKRDKDGSFRVVRAGGITKGFATAPDAARAALDKSAKSTDSDSLGGPVKHKDYNSYLTSRGVESFGLSQLEKDAGKASFGGRTMTGDELAAERDRLQADLNASKAGDKYEKRRAATIAARLYEADLKAKALGGKAPANSGSAYVATPTPAVTGGKVFQAAPGTSPASAIVNVSDALKGAKLGEVVDLGKYTAVKLPPHGTAVVGSTPVQLTHKGSGQKFHYSDAGNAAHAVATDKHGVGAGEHGLVAGNVLTNANGEGIKIGVVGANGISVSNQVTGKDTFVHHDTAKKLLDQGDWKKTGTAAASPAAKAAVEKSHPVGTAVVFKDPSEVGYPGGTVSGHALDGALVVKLPNGNNVLYELDELAGTAKTATTPPKSKGKKVGKNTAQAVPKDPDAESWMPSAVLPLKKLALEPGDKIQKQKGGWKYEYVGPHPTSPNYLRFKDAKGKVKNLPSHQRWGFVYKGDGYALQEGKPRGWNPPQAAAPKAPSAPAAPAGPTHTVEQIKGGLIMPPPGTKMGDLPDGTVIQTPDGKVGILKPGESAYTGYVAAYDIATGAKFEPPADKPPTKYSAPSAASWVPAQAAAHLKKNQAATGGVIATGSAHTTAKPTSVAGPPPKMAAVASEHKAEAAVKVTASGVTLTPDERSAAKHYTNGGYGTMNNALRSSTGVKDIGNAKRIKQLDSAIARQKPLAEDVIVSRKTDVAEWASGAQVGTVIQDNGFLSTSTYGGTWSGSVHLNILLPAGSRGLWVNGHQGASSHPSEKEVILPRGSQFHVLKRETKGSATVLYVELIA